MNWRNVIVILFLPLVFTIDNAGQTKSAQASTSAASKPILQAVKSSPAYAEVLLRKTEREADLEDLLIDYTDEFPKVKALKFELDLLQKQLDKILAVNASDTAKLTLALGKLLVRKTELEVDAWNLRRQYNADHPEVKRAQHKVEIYDKAINEILP